MTTSVQQKTVTVEQPRVVTFSTVAHEPTEKEETVVLFKSATESLMPELEALVKKNPNQLIGCGG